jgi:hypothetical protein
VSAEDNENLTSHFEDPTLIYILLVYMFQSMHIISYNESTFLSYSSPCSENNKKIITFVGRSPAEADPDFVGHKLI